MYLFKKLTIITFGYQAIVKQKGIEKDWDSMSLEIIYIPSEYVLA